ncbi:cation transporter [Sorangium sp. So ce1504]|uniref:cation diffusion facilitator family transporter n=1 Tax=Sorangium sp. So ce1504 TaxID=3133337 RepID=UPI003F614BDA
MEMTEEATCNHCTTCSTGTEERGRLEHVKRALRLEYLTVSWNIVEGVVAVTAALLAGSVALLGFGIDSFVECASGFVMIWRLRAETALRLSSEAIDAVERRAQRLVAVSLFLLAAYVAFDAVQALRDGERPEFTLAGVGITCLSLVVMRWLARAKRRVARDLGSRAMEADAFQTTACVWLSWATLAGIGLNGALGWWWADPIAALFVAAFVMKEGAATWRGDHGCC